MTAQRFVALLCALVALGASVAAGADFVDGAPSPGAFAVVAGGEASPIYVDAQDFPGVARAAGDLADDVRKVAGASPEVSRATTGFKARCILVGTLAKSAMLDRLVADRKIDAAPIAGKWESYLIQVVDDPAAGIDRALVIAGSDKRGAIYGIYDLSQRMGVSPWYWWADVPPRHRDAVYVRAGAYVQGPPKVKYRGIFINDEEPCFGGWARAKFGGVNSKVYARVFELILRLRGNYLWPAMWGKAFNEDDPADAKLADEYGIVMGTSHHEPMLRAQAEWGRHKKQYGNGEWNYATNADGLRKFWTDGIERNKAYESIVTIGMRGDGDEPMVKGGDMAANADLLERIVADQRDILRRVVDPDVTKVPQLWALYKEVADYYAHGMRVPDDVTLLWCDDNWGNIRRLPTPDERQRNGGAGVYYHFDYVGGPRSYKWINTNPLPKVWEQMNLAYRYGADRIWIVNVGDLKPMELPIEFFLKMAWDPDAMPKEQVAEFTRQWAEREFGPEHAAEIADIVSKYAKYNGWRKPELLEPTTFSLVNYQEADRVEAAWEKITKHAEEIYAALPPEYRDAFYELVLYPTKASATVAELYVAAGRNQLYARQGRASANDQAARVRQLFQRDRELSDYYNHQLAGGKWDHMMDQTHIGYTSWNDPKTNVMPKVVEVPVEDRAAMGVAVEGSASSWPGGKEPPRLPAFDSMNRQRYPVDVFRRGARPFEFTTTADKPWIKVTPASGRADKDQRLWVSIDWDAAPVGAAGGVVTLSRSGGGGEAVAIAVETVRSTDLTRDGLHASGGLTGPVAIEAESATANVAAGGARWERIPDYGRGPSAMSVFPVTAPSVTPGPRSPRLEYELFIPRAGDVHLDLVTGPTLDFVPGRGLRVAVSFDDQEPRVLDAFATQAATGPAKRPDPSGPAARDWGTWVKDNARTLTSTLAIPSPGVHTLKVWMVDPAVVLEKLVVRAGDVRRSYFGPPAEATAGAEPPNAPGR